MYVELSMADLVPDTRKEAHAFSCQKYKKMLHNITTIS